MALNDQLFPAFSLVHNLQFSPSFFLYLYMFGHRDFVNHHRTPHTCRTLVNTWRIQTNVSSLSRTREESAYLSLCRWLSRVRNARWQANFIRANIIASLSLSLWYIRLEKDIGFDFREVYCRRCVAQPCDWSEEACNFERTGLQLLMAAFCLRLPPMIRLASTYGEYLQFFFISTFNSRLCKSEGKKIAVLWLTLWEEWTFNWSFWKSICTYGWICIRIGNVN